MHLLDPLHDGGEEGMVFFEAGQLLGRRGGVELLELLGELDGFLVAFDVLEAERHLHAVEETVELLAGLGEVGGWSDEALVAAELAQWGAADTHDDVLECWV